MKKQIKIYSLVALATAFTLTGCIDETEPERGIATAEQLQASPTAFQSSLLGIPSQMCQGYLVYGDQVHETDMAYPQFMIAQTEMLGDMFVEGGNSGYDWYRNYNTFSANYGETSYMAYLPWYTLYKFVKQANSVISSAKSGSETVQSMAGSAYAARAFDYLMLMTFFEPKENNYTDVSKVANLTVPIITDTTSEAQAANNPRVTHAEMMKFILSDLDEAEKRLSDYTPSTKLVPDLSVVYGIKAKAYLWDKDWANAAKYARLAIDTNGGSPMNEDEWTNPKSAFTSATSGWMWYLHYDAENMGNLCNFTGWMSGEADWSYGSLTRPSMDHALYEHIGENDFRKTVFVDTLKLKEGYQYKTSRSQEWIEEAMSDNPQANDFALKFRCKNGNYETYSEGGAVDVPIMRIEEMYFIEALAVGESQGVSAGESLLNSFMRQYRDPNYNFTSSDLQEFAFEVLAQMRIEFWGEGNAFPVAKMLGGRELVNGVPGVMQYYTGSNYPATIYRINARGIKPNWNLVITNSETEANRALVGNNNPDPTQTIRGANGVINQFAPSNN